MSKIERVLNEMTVLANPMPSKEVLEKLFHYDPKTGKLYWKKVLAKAMPSKEVLEKLFHYDPKTGKLYWKKVQTMD